VIAGALVLDGCASIPSGSSAVSSVEVDGTHALSASDIEDKIATTESPKFLMLFQGVVYDYEVFDRFVLEKDLARVEAVYRAHGFYDAHARAGRFEYLDPDHKHVRVTIEVEEGPPTLVRDVVLRGLEGLPPGVAARAKAAAVAKLSRGKRFDEDAYDETEGDIARALTDDGYAYAKAEKHAEIDLVERFAILRYDVTPGPPATFGPVTITGLGDLPEGPVRRAIDIAPGEHYSTAKIQAAKQAVLDLAVFGNVTIDPDLPEPPPADAVVPLTVKVEPAKLHQLTLGGGVEFDPLKTDLHLIVGWDDHDFLGGMRGFHAEVKPGVVLYPLRMQTPFDAPTSLLPEEKARAELQQPGFLEARTHGVLSTQINTFPVLLTPQQSGPGVPVLGYFETKEAAGLDRAIGPAFLSLTYDFQRDQPFSYLGPRDPTLGPIDLSFIDLAFRLDFRDDKLHPHSGVYFLNDLQLAGLGGDARDLREKPDLRAYVPIARGLTWGLRGALGFLDPFNYGSTLNDPAAQAQDRAAWAKDAQLVYLRGFFSGGSTSNRGYPLYGVGPHGAVPFFSPGIAASQIANSCAQSFDPSRCATPLGGFTLWEASTELRVHVSGPFEVAVFCDASDVQKEQLKLRLGDPTRYHVACGAGARYDTPVGPIRLDVGYRIPGLNPNFHDPNVVAVDGDPGTIFGIPAAVALGIGEPF
jgi:outer membrane protein insertion porin family/translocation and assembly module TamA